MKTVNVVFNNPALGVERADDEQLQSKFAEQFERALRIFFVGAGKYLVNYDQPKSIGFIARADEAILRRDC